MESEYGGFFLSSYQGQHCPLDSDSELSEEAAPAGVEREAAAELDGTVTHDGPVFAEEPVEERAAATPIPEERQGCHLPGAPVEDGWAAWPAPPSAFDDPLLSDDTCVGAAEEAPPQQTPPDTSKVEACRQGGGDAPAQSEDEASSSHGAESTAAGSPLSAGACGSPQEASGETVGLTFGGRRLPPAEDTPAAEPPAQADARLAAQLDAFFENERHWQLVCREVARSTRFRTDPKLYAALSTGGGVFRVQVPKPYPGVQYRKSKDLNDRYPRYASNGARLTGHVEDGGEWLRINGNVFLPMRIGAIQILEPLGPEAELSQAGGQDGSSGQWTCCPTSTPDMDPAGKAGVAAPPK